MSESIHTDTLVSLGFNQVPAVPHCPPMTHQYMEENPEKAPFFYGTTVEESAATIVIDENGYAWLGHGTTDLADLGFTKCPVPY